MNGAPGEERCGKYCHFFPDSSYLEHLSSTNHLAGDYRRMSWPGWWQGHLRYQNHSRVTLPLLTGPLMSLRNTLWCPRLPLSPTSGWQSSPACTPSSHEVPGPTGACSSLLPHQPQRSVSFLTPTSAEGDVPGFPFQAHLFPPSYPGISAFNTHAREREQMFWGAFHTSGSVLSINPPTDREASPETVNYSKCFAILLSHLCGGYHGLSNTPRTSSEFCLSSG